MGDDRSNGNLGNVVVAFLAGAAIGGALGILFAPRSGKETREKIKGMADETRDRIRHIAEDAEMKIAEALHEGKETIIEKRDMVKAAVAAGRAAMAEEKAKHKA